MAALLKTVVFLIEAISNAAGEKPQKKKGKRRASRRTLLLRMEH